MPRAPSAARTRRVLAGVDSGCPAVPDCVTEEYPQHAEFSSTSSSRWGSRLLLSRGPIQHAILSASGAAPARFCRRFAGGPTCWAHRPDPVKHTLISSVLNPEPSDAPTSTGLRRAPGGEMIPTTESTAVPARQISPTPISQVASGLSRFVRARLRGADRITMPCHPRVMGRTSLSALDPSHNATRSTESASSTSRPGGPRYHTPPAGWMA